MLHDQRWKVLLKLLCDHADDLGHDGLLCDRQDLGEKLLHDLLSLVGGLECEWRLDAGPVREAWVLLGADRRGEAGCEAARLLRGGHSRAGQALGCGGHVRLSIEVVRAAAASAAGFVIDREQVGDPEIEILVASLARLSPEDRRHVAALVRSLLSATDAAS